jgi:ABC-type glutathione transport system ATPase component
MSQHLDEILTDAASKNLSAAEAFEALLDRELEARQTRSIDRRFRLSRLQAKHSIDGFNFNHHKTRLQCKSRILRLLDLGFLEKGTAVVLIGNPGVGKTFLAKIIAWRACQANRRVLFTTAMDMLNHLLASQVDHSLIRKLKLYTEPTFLLSRRTRVPFARPADLESVLSGHFHSSQPQEKYAHHHQHSLFRVGEYPAQHHHRDGHRRPLGRKLRDHPSRR